MAEAVRVQQQQQAERQPLRCIYLPLFSSPVLTSESSKNIIDVQNSKKRLKREEDGFYRHFV